MIEGWGPVTPPLGNPASTTNPGGTMTTADLLGKILQVVMGLAIFAAVVGLLIFFIDRAPKKGRDYWQLAGFLLPALIFISIGLIYPAIRTSIQAVRSPNGARISAEVNRNCASVWAGIAPSHISRPLRTGYSTVPPVRIPSLVMAPWM